MGARVRPKTETNARPWVLFAAVNLLDLLVLVNKRRRTRSTGSAILVCHLSVIDIEKDICFFKMSRLLLRTVAAIALVGIRTDEGAIRGDSP